MYNIIAAIEYGPQDFRLGEALSYLASPHIYYYMYTHCFVTYINIVCIHERSVTANIDPSFDKSCTYKIGRYSIKVGILDNNCCSLMFVSIMTVRLELYTYLHKVIHLSYSTSFYSNAFIQFSYFYTIFNYILVYNFSYHSRI